MFEDSRSQNTDDGTRAQPRGWAPGWRRGVMLAAGLAVTGTIGIASARVTRNQFTTDDVRAISAQLRDADPKIYLVRLPDIQNGRIVGSRMYGNLPMRKVEQLAESMKIDLDRNANVLAVFDPDDPGDQRGGCSGGGGGGGGTDCCGPGSHVPAGARDLTERIDILLGDIEVSAYQFLR